MEKLNDKYRVEGSTTGRGQKNIHKDSIKERERAIANGKIAAEKWVRSASYQEMKDVLPRPNITHDTNYFAFMRSIFFRSIEKICPDEARGFKRINNEAFLKGWREGVIAIWHYRKSLSNL
jgi:hypothetical protein